MDAKFARTLVRELDEAIAQVIVRVGLKKLPLPPDRHTMHSMAKAAVAVYEAAIENRSLS